MYTEDIYEYFDKKLRTKYILVSNRIYLSSLCRIIQTWIVLSPSKLTHLEEVTSIHYVLYYGWVYPPPYIFIQWGGYKLQTRRGCIKWPPKRVSVLVKKIWSHLYAYFSFYILLLGPIYCLNSMHCLSNQVFVDIMSSMGFA